MKIIERDVAGTFIFSRDGKVLLGKSMPGGVYQNVWTVPGGGIEAGETPLEAAKRETYEEVGVRVDDNQISQIDGIGRGESEKMEAGEPVLVRMKFYDFRVDMSHNAADIQITCNDDFCDARWFTREEARKLPLAPGVTKNLTFLGFI